MITQGLIRYSNAKRDSCWDSYIGQSEKIYVDLLLINYVLWKISNKTEFYYNLYV